MVPNRSDTNQPVQAQKRARSLKFWIEVEEELYYPSSENKGDDQLQGNREADLRLCFRLERQIVGFPMRRLLSIYFNLLITLIGSLTWKLFWIPTTILL